MTEAKQDLRFSSLALPESLVSNLESLGFKAMTEIQARSLPHILRGEDVIAQAQTGSGKTAAFALGMLANLEPKTFRAQGLVLCPTRELAEQVAGELRRLARQISNVKVLTLAGGAPLGPQIASLAHQAHIIVGTPGRLLKHLRAGRLRLGSLNTLVFDEADRLFDMGFADEINDVLGFAPARRQTLLFSATFPPEIEEMARAALSNPTRVDTTDAEPTIEVTHYIREVTKHTRLAELVRALAEWGGQLNLVFCNTKKDCDEVAQYLQSKSIVAAALHGDLEQNDRNQVLARFANRSCCVLVASDVAARGLDIQGVDAVFNYELPAQPEVYVHRVGRTGRAGANGVAVSLVAERENKRLNALDQDYELVPDYSITQAADSGLQIQPVAPDDLSKLDPPMRTIELNAGRKQKLRPGDIVGAITASGDISGEDIGKIDIFPMRSFVAVTPSDVDLAIQQLSDRPVKGRQCRARMLR